MLKITKKELVDCISIPIMSLAPSVVLYHKVKLGSTNSATGNRDYYHNEFVYESNAYKDVKRVSTVRLTHSSILSIQFKDEVYSDALILNITNRDFFCRYANATKKSLKHDDLILKVGDKYKINSAYTDERLLEFYRGKFISLNPKLTYNEQLGEPEVLIEMCIDKNRSTYIDIKEDRFKTMLKFIKNFDFHLAGLMAINYLQTAEIGVREIEFNNRSVALHEEFEETKPPEMKIPKSVQTTNNSMSTLGARNSRPSVNKGW